MVRVCNTVAFSGCSLSKEDWGYGCFLISCKSGSTMKEIPYKLCGTGNLLQWLEFPKSWRELGQSGSIKKEKVDDYRKVTNWMSWRNEGEQVEKLADKAPKWTVKRIWENIYGKLLILCGCCLWGPANSFLIMVKDDHWSAELASGRRSGCRADKHKDQLGAISTCAFDLHQIITTLAFTSGSQFQLFSPLLRTVFPTAHRGRLCLPSLTHLGQTWCISSESLTLSQHYSPKSLPSGPREKI